jgi:hypothetical protein
VGEPYRGSGNEEISVKIVAAEAAILAIINLVLRIATNKGLEI